MCRFFKKIGFLELKWEKNKREICLSRKRKPKINFLLLVGEAGPAVFWLLLHACRGDFFNLGDDTFNLGDNIFNLGGVHHLSRFFWVN